MGVVYPENIFWEVDYRQVNDIPVSSPAWGRLSFAQKKVSETYGRFQILFVAGELVNRRKISHESCIPTQIVLLAPENSVLRFFACFQKVVGNFNHIVFVKLVSCNLKKF